ncbi:MAG: HU family DNA-binding protein [Acidimicrobiales bacterium]|nr:HU family DNA-binding protein [Acidimicrobiales bacterium]
MNKSDVIGAMAERAGTSSKDAGACLDAFFDVVADAVAAGGDKVSIPGWISFEQVHRAARTARNPQTGAPVEVAARNACKVSVGSKLKAAANRQPPAAAPSW